MPLQDDALLKSSVAFYRLVAAWMLRLASPAAAATGQPELPLPTPAPLEFRLLPVSATFQPPHLTGFHMCMLLPPPFDI